MFTFSGFRLKDSLIGKGAYKCCYSVELIVKLNPYVSLKLVLRIGIPKLLDKKLGLPFPSTILRVPSLLTYCN